MNWLRLTVCVMPFVAMVGCDQGGSDSNRDDVAQPAIVTWDTLINADPDGDAIAIDDVDAMTAQLDATFGDAESDPVEAEETDTLHDVTQRAAGG